MPVINKLREEGLLTTSEAAEVIGVHRNTVHNAIKSGKLTSEWVGPVRGVKKSDAEKFRKEYFGGKKKVSALGGK